MTCISGEDLVNSLSLSFLHTKPTDAHTLARCIWRYRVQGVLYHNTTKIQVKVSLPLCWNDANPLVFTEMCQTEHSLSQSSLCLYSIFISLSFSLACNQPLCMAENNIALLKRDHTWEKQPTPAALSCKIKNYKNNNKKKTKTGQHLTNHFEISITVIPAPAFPYFCFLSNPGPFLAIHLAAKHTAKKEKKDSNAQHVQRNTCVLSKMHTINTHSFAHSHK